MRIIHSWATYPRSAGAAGLESEYTVRALGDSRSALEDALVVKRPWRHIAHSDPLECSALWLLRTCSLACRCTLGEKRRGRAVSEARFAVPDREVQERG